MAFAHDMSCECTKSQLDLFSVPITRTSTEHGSWVEYYPITIESDGSPVEFDISGTGYDYIDFANKLLHLKAKVTQANGDNLPADAAVGPVNLFLHSLSSGHFAQRGSDNFFHQHISLQSHAGKVAEICRRLVVPVDSFLVIYVLFNR